jgi:hypothetical protein
MTINIVVERYNENIEWTKEIQNVIIYNKGNQLNIENEIMIQKTNTDKQGDSFYKYIVDNYDNLSDYTIFLRSNVFDNSLNLINIINYLNEYTKTNEINFEFLNKININYDFSGSQMNNLAPTYGSDSKFIVSKKNILKKNKNFYSKIIEMLESKTGPFNNHPIDKIHEIILGNNYL